MYKEKKFSTAWWLKEWRPTIHTRIEVNDSNFEVVYLFLTHGYSPSNYKMRNTQNITFNTFAAQIYSKIDEEGEPNFIFKETINHCKAKMHLIRLINILNLVGSILRKRNHWMVLEEEWIDGSTSWIREWLSG